MTSIERHLLIALVSIYALATIAACKDSKTANEAEQEEAEQEEAGQKETGEPETSEESQEPAPMTNNTSDDVAALFPGSVPELPPPAITLFFGMPFDDAQLALPGLDPDTMTVPLDSYGEAVDLTIKTVPSGELKEDRLTCLELRIGADELKAVRDAWGEAETAEVKSTSRGDESHQLWFSPNGLRVNATVDEGYQGKVARLQYRPYLTAEQIFGLEGLFISDRSVDWLGSDLEEVRKTLPAVSFRISERSIPGFEGIRDAWFQFPEVYQWGPAPIGFSLVERDGEIIGYSLIVTSFDAEGRQRLVDALVAHFGEPVKTDPESSALTFEEVEFPLQMTRSGDTGLQVFLGHGHMPDGPP